MSEQEPIYITDETHPAYTPPDLVASEVKRLQSEVIELEDRLGSMHREATVVAFTDLYINKRRISVTARAGASEADVLGTVRSLLGAVQTIESAYAERKVEAPALAVDAEPVEADGAPF